MKNEIEVVEKVNLKDCTNYTYIQDVLVNIRKMTKEEIINEFKDYLTEEQKLQLKEI